MSKFLTAALGSVALGCAVGLAFGRPAHTAAAVHVTRIPNDGLQPEVVRSDSGILHMLYFAGEPGAGNLFYVRSADEGGTFTARVRVNSQDGSAIASGTIRGGQMALGRDGRIHVAWNGSGQALPKSPADPRTGQTGSAMLYARSNTAGTVFEPQRSIMQRSVALDGGGSIAADQSGNVYIAWHGNALADGNNGETNRRIFVARSTDEGRTFAPEALAWPESTGACSCCGVRLFASRSSGLFLLFRSAADQINRDIYLLRSTDRGRTFRGTRVHEWDINACPMTSMSMIESPAGMFASWETDGQVYFGPVDAGRPGVSKIFAPAGDPNRRKHPRLAARAGDHLLMVWTEGTAHHRGGSIAWQLFASSGEPIGSSTTRGGLPASSYATAVPRSDGFTIFY